MRRLHRGRLAGTGRRFRAAPAAFAQPRIPGRQSAGHPRAAGHRIAHQAPADAAAGVHASGGTDPARQACNRVLARLAVQHAGGAGEEAPGRHLPHRRVRAHQTYRRHDAVVGVSRGVKEDLVSMFPPLRGKVHTIYNGVPLDNVVAVGRLEAVKDYATLVDAAALLDDPGIAFTILGEGSEHDALQKRIDERPSRTSVTLAGHIDNPFPVSAGAGAFALTSIRESFGNVLVEALCLGVPVISTPAGGAGECFVEDETGHLLSDVAHPDLHEACEKVASMVGRVRSNAQLRQQSRERAQMLVSLDAMLTKFLGLCMPVMGMSENDERMDAAPLCRMTA
ncbi:hypothetical protein G6F65_014671 [Rhizopus arrhizus]|nr:hypothetical protein G6F65_014671 [Rhizopus arrhizus]